MSEMKIGMSSMPKYKGETKDFSRFSGQFQSFVEIMGVGPALQGSNADMPSSEAEDLSGLTAAERKKKEQALSMNRKAVAMLTLALDSNKLLAILEKGKTDEFPSGRADLIWEELHKKYQPKDSMSKVEMIQKLFDMEWGENEDPNDVFDKVLELESRYAKPGKKLSEDLKMAALITKAPKVYFSAIVSAQQAKGESLSLDDLQVTIDRMWRLHKKGVEDKDDDDDDDTEGISKGETALGAVTFYGSCNYCHEKGHKKNDCPKLKQKWTFKGRCNKCGGSGHMARNCPSQEVEAGNVAVEEEVGELLI